MAITPSTPDGWKEVAHGFGRRWNFPHACGATDGKHIKIFSIFLIGLVDADYRFISELPLMQRFSTGFPYSPTSVKGDIVTLTLSPSQTTTTRCHTSSSAMTRYPCKHTW